LTVLGLNRSFGHVLVRPVQSSARSHAPAVARQVAPALPAGCWQASLVPLHVSLVHGLPSSVHAVPLGCLASAEQLALLPGQKSSASHSSTEARQSTVEDLKALFGHVELLPVQVSATSQMPAAARQVAPLLPAGCWQASLVPLQVSLVQGLPSSVQAVPLATFASAEQLALFPGQKSSRSHSPTDARQSVSEDWNASFGHVELLPVHVSATSQTPAVARHVVPALPGAC